MENHDSDFKCLQLIGTWRRENTFMCICALVSFKSLQDNHPFVC